MPASGRPAVVESGHCHQPTWLTGDVGPPGSCWRHAHGDQGRIRAACGGRLLRSLTAAARGAAAGAGRDEGTSSRSNQGTGVGVAQHSIGDDDQLAHNGDECNERFLALLNQPLTECPQLGIVLTGDQRRHKQRSFDLRPAAFHAAIGVACSALSRMLGQPGQGRRLAAFEPSQFRHQANQCGGGSWPDAGDPAQSLGIAAQRRGPVDQAGDVGVNRSDLGLQAPQQRPDIAVQLCRAGSPGAIAPGRALPDQATSQHHQCVVPG